MLHLVADKGVKGLGYPVNIPGVTGQKIPARPGPVPFEIFFHYLRSVVFRVDGNGHQLHVLAMGPEFSLHA